MSFHNDSKVKILFFLVLLFSIVNAYQGNGYSGGYLYCDFAASNTSTSTIGEKALLANASCIGNTLIFTTDNFMLKEGYIETAEGAVVAPQTAATAFYNASGECIYESVGANLTVVGSGTTNSYLGGFYYSGTEWAYWTLATTTTTHTYQYLFRGKDGVDRNGAATGIAGGPHIFSINLCPDHVAFLIDGGLIGNVTASALDKKEAEVIYLPKPTTGSSHRIDFISILPRSNSGRNATKQANVTCSSGICQMDYFSKSYENSSRAQVSPESHAGYSIFSDATLRNGTEFANDTIHGMAMNPGFAIYRFDAPSDLYFTNFTAKSRAVNGMNYSYSLDGITYTHMHYIANDVIGGNETILQGKNKSIWIQFNSTNAGTLDYFEFHANLTIETNSSPYLKNLAISDVQENIIPDIQLIFYGNDRVNSRYALNNETPYLLYAVDNSSGIELHLKKFNIRNNTILWNTTIYTDFLKLPKKFFVIDNKDARLVGLSQNYLVSTVYFFINSTTYGKITIYNTTETTYSTGLFQNEAQDNSFYGSQLSQYATFSNLANFNWYFGIPTLSSIYFLANGTNYTIIDSQLSGPLGGVENGTLNIQWQTAAENSNLSSWIFAAPNKGGCALQNYSIAFKRYNETTRAITVVKQLTECLDPITLQNLTVLTEKYNQTSYVIVSNATFTRFYAIESNLAFNVTGNMATSPPIFIDENTIVFVNGSIAYSCYFPSGSCVTSNMTNWGYDFSYNRSIPAAYQRFNTTEEWINGKIYLDSVNGKTVFLYNTWLYDSKIRCFDEVQGYRKNLTITITGNQTNVIYVNSSYGYVAPTFPIGNGLKFHGTCNNGTQRLYITNTIPNLDMYSLNTWQGAYYTFTTTNQFGIAIQNITLTAKKLSQAKQTNVIVEECISDFSGLCTLFLQPFTTYKMSTNGSGYNRINFDFYAGTTTSASVKLQFGNGTDFQIQNITEMLHDISYSFTSDTAFQTKPFNMTFYVNSSSCSLDFYGMNVTRTINGTSSVVFTDLIFNSTCGGNITFQIDNSTGNGTYRIQAVIKHSNYTVFYPQARMYTYGTSQGLSQASEMLKNGDIMGGFSYFLIVLFIATLVGGYFSRFTLQGAGTAAIFIIWIGVLLNPAAVIVTMFGTSITITSAAFLLTLILAAILTLTTYI